MMKQAASAHEAACVLRAGDERASCRRSEDVTAAPAASPTLSPQIDAFGCTSHGVRLTLFRTAHVHEENNGSPRRPADLRRGLRSYSFRFCADQYDRTIVRSGAGLSRAVGALHSVEEPGRRHHPSFRGGTVPCCDPSIDPPWADIVRSRPSVFAWSRAPSA